MELSVLLISHHPDDLQFWKSVADANKMAIRNETDPAAIEIFLRGHADSIVIWDAGNPELRIHEETLRNFGKPEHVFAVTDDFINRSPELFQPPSFAHHIYRRYDSLAGILCNRLIERLFSPDPFGFLTSLTGVTATHQVTVKDSLEKQPTVEALTRFLETQGVASKIARLAADAIDELIMNALFDAPCTEDGRRYRRSLDRASSFPLTDKELVEVSVAVTPHLIGISVADNFGSIDRQQVLKSLSKNLKDVAYVPPTGDPGAGLGLHKINQSSMTLIFASKPKVRTEVLVVFPNTQSYREMKLGFCCFSVVCH